jgi:hypothetical protein
LIPSIMSAFYGKADGSSIGKPYALTMGKKGKRQQWGSAVNWSPAPIAKSPEAKKRLASLSCPHEFGAKKAAGV